MNRKHEPSSRSLRADEDSNDYEVLESISRALSDQRKGEAEGVAHGAADVLLNSGAGCLTFARCRELSGPEGFARPSEQSHLNACRYCRRRVEKFAELRTQDELEPLAPPPPAPPLWALARPSHWGAAALAAVVLLLLGSMILLRRLDWQWPPVRQAAEARPSTEPSLTSTPSVASGNINGEGQLAGGAPTGPERSDDATAPGGGRRPGRAKSQATVSRRPRNEVAALNLDHLRADERAAVLESLRSGSLSLSEDVVLLNSPADITRGEIGGCRQCEPTVVMNPANTVVTDSRPTLSWEGVEGVQFTVSVKDRAYGDVARSDALSAKSWRLPRALATGLYFWQVSARRGDGTEVNVPALPVMFKVLTDPELKRLERAVRRANSHLVAGILYARAGLLDDAEHDLKLAAAGSPRPEKAAKLLRRVRELRGRTSSR